MSFVQWWSVFSLVLVVLKKHLTINLILFLMYGIHAAMNEVNCMIKTYLAKQKCLTSCVRLVLMWQFCIVGVHSQEQGKYLGNYNTNRYDPNSVNNEFGQYGSEFSSESINNEYGEYGSPYSNKSVNNPYASNAPKLYDQNGNYRGRLSSNPYDSESTSNPHGEYGSSYSSKSVNNPYGAGSPYSNDVISIYDGDSAPLENEHECGN